MQLTIKEMAKHLGTSEAKLRKELIQIGLSQMQNDAERLASIDRWNERKENPGLMNEFSVQEPGIEHFKRALANYQLTNS